VKLKSKLIIFILSVLLIGNVFLLVKAIAKGNFELNLEGAINFKGEIDENTFKIKKS